MKPLDLSVYNLQESLIMVLNFNLNRVMTPAYYNMKEEETRKWHCFGIEKH